MSEKRSATVSSADSQSTWRRGEVRSIRSSGYKARPVSLLTVSGNDKPLLHCLHVLILTKVMREKFDLTPLSQESAVHIQHPALWLHHCSGQFASYGVDRSLTRHEQSPEKAALLYVGSDPVVQKPYRHWYGTQQYCHQPVQSRGSPVQEYRPPDKCVPIHL